MYNTNFMTTLNCCQQILPLMKSRGFGRIINMGSRTAADAMPLAGPYCASKMAVHTLTKTVALENGDGITCNAILPGIIDTPVNRKTMETSDRAGWTSMRQIANKIEHIICSNANGVLAEF